MEDPSIIEKACNIGEVYQAFEPLEPLDAENKEFYVKLLTTQLAQVESADTSKFGLRIDKNPLVEEHRDEIAPGNRRKLTQIVERRLANTELIDPDAMEALVKYSGGNIRQLFKVIQESAINAFKIEEDDAKSIGIKDIEDGVGKLRVNYSGALHGRLEVLNAVMKSNRMPAYQKQEKPELALKYLKEARSIAPTAGYHDIQERAETSITEVEQAKSG